jgi:ubiquinone biosynthesis protein COQ9
MMQVDEQTAVVIDALLPQVPFDGWTGKAVRAALSSIGEDPADAPLMFPGGAGEMIEAFWTLADQRMVQAAQTAALAAFRVPARVRAAMAIWFEQNRGNKEAIRRALSWVSLPVHAGLGARITAGSVDAIWHAAGDNSADFSWYTKRGILAAVYSATLLFWLRDQSPDDEETLRFLDRRLGNVAAIGGVRRKISERLARFRAALPGRA